MLSRVLRKLTSHFPARRRNVNPGSRASTRPHPAVTSASKRSCMFSHSDAKRTAILEQATHLELVHDGQVIQLHPFWLRDNCQCSSCFDHATAQRMVRFQDIDPEIQPVRHILEGNSLNITWPDGHQSSFSVSWLAGNDIKNTFKSKVDRVLWNGDNYHELKCERMKYNDFMHEEECIKLFLRNIIKYGFTFVDEVPADIESTKMVCQRVSHLHETIFGKIMSITGQGSLSLDDTYFTNIALDAHTDLSYYQHAPGIQFFHCLYHDGKGGETLMEDGFYCAQKLLETEPEAFDVLANTPVRHSYAEPGVYCQSLDTIIRLHPYTKEIQQLRFNNYRRTMSLPLDRTMKFYRSIGALTDIIEDQRNVHWEKLHPGTVYFIDNWRVMHGRRAYTGERTLCGGYLDRDSWMCKAQSLGIIDH
ncbi:trimethyllysine dioxygenase, mitochondrial-like isoform X1 [Lineus longissimus]|uniref:trimethyllysine dioxygenase, mitochondrial-like isoform X1 n=1 Tax=Lineus longissimus TaxID=88925 RepID=UPI002B4C43E0